MMKMSSTNILVLKFLFVLFFIGETKPTNTTKLKTILIFGDSTADPGNNNYITTPIKANFPPYGKDYMQHIPTGRFTNGKLPNDYIAEYLGVKEYVPPYLDPTLSIEELISGVSFASSGTGFDPLTHKITSVIPVSQQVEYFKDYKSRLAATIGEENTQNLIEDAFFLVSAGINDFVVNYFTVPIRREHYSIPDYVDFCLQNVMHFLQELMNLGARHIGRVGVPPLGCLPIVITVNSNDAISNRGCITNISSTAQLYNQKLQILLQSTLTQHNPNSRIAYLDFYGPLADMTVHPGKYGFEDVSRGCCGTGILESSYLCNPKSYICPDASKYIYFDSIHPTEKSYNILADAWQPTISYITLGY